jgi:hypothetical protein
MLQFRHVRGFEVVDYFTFSLHNQIRPLVMISDETVEGLIFFK